MGFLNETRTCEFKQDMGTVKIGGVAIGPFKSGETATLPNWVIEKLAERGIAQVHIQNAYDSTRNVDILHNKEQKQKHSSLEELRPGRVLAKRRRLEQDHQLGEDVDQQNPLARLDPVQQAESTIRLPEQGPEQVRSLGPLAQCFGLVAE